MSKSMDVFSMYQTGCEFSDCADFAMKAQDVVPFHGLFYSVPAVVNSAFACEVFLKLLLEVEQIEFKRMHQLEELFNQLPEQVKTAIQQSTIQKYGTWTDVFGLNLLHQISDAFVQWRYNYEHDFGNDGTMKIEIGFLVAFRNALREKCSDYFRDHMKDLRSC